MIMVKEQNLMMLRYPLWNSYEESWYKTAYGEELGLQEKKAIWNVKHHGYAGYWEHILGSSMWKLGKIN
jgi:hypothetical protein